MMDGSLIAHARMITSPVVGEARDELTALVPADRDGDDTVEQMRGGVIKEVTLQCEGAYLAFTGRRRGVRAAVSNYCR